jgi:leucyl aminopeptidase
VLVSIGGDALGALGPSAQFVDTNGQVAIAEVDDSELPAIAQAVHEQTGRCGGFLVYDSLADAEAALVIQRDRPAPRVDYTLDRPVDVRRVLATLDKARIVDTIRDLSAMPSRYYQSATGAAASDWLRDRWKSFTTRSDVTIDLVDHGWAQKSVVLTIPGTTRAGETVVIGGHLDSITFARGGGNAPGADDDASGIATMTEVIRALLAADYRPERTMVFIAYAAEEVGLRGSQDIVKKFQQRGVDVVGALQLDMTNYQGSDKDIWLMKDFASAEQNQFLIRLIDTYVGATWGLDACGYGCSDHASWYRAGVPASMPFEARMKERNMAIHTAKDTLETSGGNADHAIKFARLATAYAIELGKGTTGGDEDEHGLTLALLGLLAAGGIALQRKLA